MNEFISLSPIQSDEKEHFNYRRSGIYWVPRGAFNGD